jgi:hypothetical protein
MKRFWKHGDRLERELRAQRPEPRTDFLHALESRIRSEGRWLPSRRLRLGLAGVLTAAMLTAVGAFGGLGYAATGVQHAVHTATHVVAPVHKAAPVHKSAPAQAAAPVQIAAPVQQNQPLSSAQAQYRVALCFFRHTIYVDSRAARILERLGAKLGPCKGHRRTPPARTKVVCIKKQVIRVTAKDAKALVKARKATRGFCKIKK